MLLGRIPVTESPSARLLESPVYMLLEVLLLEESGETRVVDTAALGIRDAVAADAAAEDDGCAGELGVVEQVDIADVAAGEIDAVGEEESVKTSDGMTVDAEAG